MTHLRVPILNQAFSDIMEEHNGSPCGCRVCRGRMIYALAADLSVLHNDCAGEVDLLASLVEAATVGWMCSGGSMQGLLGAVVSVANPGARVEMVTSKENPAALTEEQLELFKRPVEGTA